MTIEEAKQYITENFSVGLMPDSTGRGYVCPICGRGTKENVPGLFSNDFGSHYTCHGCKIQNATALDIVALMNGVDMKEPEAVKLRAAADAFGVTIDKTLVPSVITIEDIKRQSRWIVYRDKKPLNPHNLRGCNKGACLSLPEEKRIKYCATYEEALKAASTDDSIGIGFQMGLGSLGCRLWGVDLDDCFDEDGTLRPRAAQIVDRFNTYTEYSVSGKGLHIIGISEKERPNKINYATGEMVAEKKGGRHFKNVPDRKDATEGQIIKSIELYADGHFFTYTGRPYGVAHSLRNIEEPMEWLLGVLEKRRYNLDQKEKEKRKEERVAAQPKSKKIKEPVKGSQRGNNSANEAIIQTMRSWKNKTINALLDSTEEAPDKYGSGSEADFALLCKLAAFTHDPAQIRSIMESTKRADIRMDKWVNGSYDGLDWLDNEINKAIKATPIKYNTKKRKQPTGTKEVSQRKSLPKVEQTKIEARLKDLPDGATDKECEQFSQMVARRIQILVPNERKKLEEALDRYGFDINGLDLYDAGLLQRLRHAMDAVRDDAKGLARATGRYRVAKHYLTFMTDSRSVAKFIYACLGHEIHLVARLDRVTGSNYYQSLVLPQLRRVIENRMGVTPNGITQQGSYPDTRLAIVSDPVNALTNPKHKKHRQLLRHEPVTFQPSKYPDINVTIEVPEGLELSLYDRSVLDAVFSVAEWNKTSYLPLNLICQVVKGDRNYQPTESERKAVEASIWRLNDTKMTYRKGIRWVKGGLISVLVFGETVNNQPDVITVFLNGIQLIFQYSKKDLMHIERYPSCYREVPGLKKSIANIPLVQYLLGRVLLARRMTRLDSKRMLMSDNMKSQMTFSDSVEYKTIWDQVSLGVNDSNPRRTRQKRLQLEEETIPLIMEHWISVGLIHSYDMTSEGIEFEGALYPPKGEK